MLATSLVLLLISSSLASALPSLLPRDPVAQLISIAPTSGSCANPPAPGECATASEAVGPLISGFAKYGITTAAEQAALLSWMAFESDDFKYNKNHFPGVPGQGTRCMMSPTFVKEYASSIPALAPQVAATTDPASVLALVSSDQYSFASASWFLSTQCSQSVRSQLQTGSDAGWEGFITDCVQTTVTDARTAYWTRAKAALYV